MGAWPNQYGGAKRATVNSQVTSSTTFKINMLLSMKEICKWDGTNPAQNNFKQAERLLNANHLIKCGKSTPNDGTCAVKVIALCLKTSNLKDVPHEIVVYIREDDSILSMVCSCKAGAGEKCKHCVATLLYCYRNNIVDISDLSCTSCKDLKCSWKNNQKDVLQNYSSVLLSEHSCFPVADRPAGQPGICPVGRCKYDNPLLNELPLEQDTRLLLDTLPTDLPLSLTIAKIDDDIFWKRCYCTRWPTKLPIPKPKIIIKEKISENFIENSSEEDIENNSENNNSEECTNDSSERSNSNKLDKNNGCAWTWKRCYLEMHMQEAIENLKPEEYNPQEIKSLVELCQNYVKSLKINQMLARTITADSLDRVPLRSIIIGLSLLTELKICYKQTYAGESFDWHIVKTTTNDIKNLAAGLKNCNLTSFSIINSDIDCDKLITLSRSLLKNPNIQNLDFSHCNISDKGSAALSVLIRDSLMLQSINMTNNSITKNGAEFIAFALSRFQNQLKKLCLDLNKLDMEGGNFFASALMSENCNLEALTLPGCGLTQDNSTLVEVLKFNEKLKVLDLSNNRMGEDVGELILEMLEWNNALEKVDVRMCNLSPSAIFAVQDKIKLKCRKICDHTPPKLHIFNENDIMQVLNSVLADVEEEEDYEDEFDYVNDQVIDQADDEELDVVIENKECN